MVRTADEKSVSPGDSLRLLFKKFSPCLILIDEWVAYARQPAMASAHAGHAELDGGLKALSWESTTKSDPLTGHSYKSFVLTGRYLSPPSNARATAPLHLSFLSGVTPRHITECRVSYSLDLLM
jgi:hypothetical protein